MLRENNMGTDLNLGIIRGGDRRFREDLKDLLEFQEDSRMLELVT